jgi:hypothetical protein
MKCGPSNNQWEIFSGSLLPQRHSWQALKQQLPQKTCLLVSNLNNPRQTNLMLKLGRSLRKNRGSVFVLSVG